MDPGFRETPCISLNINKVTYVLLEFLVQAYFLIGSRKSSVKAAMSFEAKPERDFFAVGIPLQRRRERRERGGTARHANGARRGRPLLIPLGPLTSELK